MKRLQRDYRYSDGILGWVSLDVQGTKQMEGEMEPRHATKGPSAFNDEVSSTKRRTSVRISSVYES